MTISRTLPLTAILLAILALWLVGSVWLNSPQVIDYFERHEQAWSMSDLIAACWSMERPVLPAPQQVAADLYESLSLPPTSKRSLWYHAWVTGSATLLGFGFGAMLGIGLAIGIVHVRTLDRSLMPWIVASQTVPILAIAPMIVVVLGALGFSGLLPKAIISMYLCFFPIAIGLVKGLRSPDPLQLDLMRTYCATQTQYFCKLRWPSATPFLFTALKIAIAISLTGTIVGELPTGAEAGLGTRLLSGSYFGQTVQIWSALAMAAFMGMILVKAVSTVEKLVFHHMGGWR